MKRATVKGYGLFDQVCLENGAQRRVRAAEIAEAWRLWWKHKDIRTGRVKVA